MLTALLIAVPAIILSGRVAVWIATKDRRDRKVPPGEPDGQGPLLVINGEVFRPEETNAGGLDVGAVETVFRGIADIAFTVETNRTRVYETVSGIDLADFGLVQIAAYPRPTGTLLSAITAYLADRQRPVVNMAQIGAPTKLYQLIRLAQDGLPVPLTFYLPRRLLNDAFEDLAERLCLPFVLKAMNASGGRLNYLIHNEQEFLLHLLDPDQKAVAFLAQQFIPNNGTFRLLVLGDQAPIVIHRCSTDGTHLTNTERGGHATLFDTDTFDDDALAMAVRGAALMGCEVAGVNLVQHRDTRQWHVLEVSSSPAIGNGAFAAEKTGAYATYLHNKLSRRPVLRPRPPHLQEGRPR